MAAVSNVSSTIIELGIRNHPYPFFSRIADGQKTVEVRYLSGYIGRIRVGDTIRFCCGRNQVLCHVSQIRRYSTYRTLLETEDLEKVIPGVKSVEAALETYRTFPCYHYASKDSTPKVLAIEIKKVERKGEKRKAEETEPNAEQNQVRVQENGASSSAGTGETDHSTKRHRPGV